ncbi:MAG: DUF3466 family protein [Proteobacteria bacterium]|nr:DUF3466 family protein [Pseudomonadota bacterium]
MRKLLIAAILTFFSIASARAETTYAIKDVGPLWKDGGIGGVFAMNIFGEVVGQQSSKPFLYSGGTTTILDISGYATDINSKHQVVGVSSSNHAFLYDNGLMTDIGDLGYGYDVYAEGINEAGQIVGTSLNGTGTGFSRAFIYTNGTMISLGTLGGGGSSYGFDINNLGDAVGDSNNRAFIYKDGSMSDIGTLGGSMGFARSINDSREIVGYSDIAGNAYVHAFLYHDGAMKDLTPVFSGNSWAWDINNKGQIVGTLGSTFGDRAFLYDNNLLTDLNTLLPLGSNWSLIHARSINDAGQIAGEGFLNGEFHAFLLSPVPEPKIYAMLLVGLGLVYYCAYRRIQRRKATYIIE